MKENASICAIVYDFDGTLCPKPMQEETLFVKMQINPQEFWKEVNVLAREHQADPNQTYLYLLAKRAKELGVSLTKQDLRGLANKITYFPGLFSQEQASPNNWFTALQLWQKTYAPQMVLRHYVISAGLQEIIEGSTIRQYFHNVFASRYAYSEKGEVLFPSVVVTETSKTQYLFRINKGLESPLTDINTHMPLLERPIPFRNIVYIGDGMTDVPSLAVTRGQGGHAIAVYPDDGGLLTGQEKKIAVCVELLQSQRVDFIAQADFTPGKELYTYVACLLQQIARSNEVFQRKAAQSIALKIPFPSSP